MSDQQMTLVEPRPDPRGVARRDNFAATDHRAGSVSGNIEQSRAIAEIQGAVFMAHQFPRRQDIAISAIENDCTRLGLAQAAIYTYARGGQEISGPSIRLAEVLAQRWGNIEFGFQELDQKAGSEGVPGESTVRAFAWDLETNFRRSITFTVTHTRHTRNKPVQFLTDPRDIYELVANQAARRVRACVLAVIPGDVVEAAVEACELTLRTKTDVTPEGIKKLVDTFAPFGVTAAMIAKKCQCKIDAIRPAQMVNMRKIYASLRDGIGTVADYFELPEIGTDGEKLAALADKAAPKTTTRTKPAAKPEPEPQPEPQPTETEMYGSEQPDENDSLFGDA